MTTHITVSCYVAPTVCRMGETTTEFVAFIASLNAISFISRKFVVF